MRSLLLIPSLRSDAYIQHPDLNLSEAIEQIIVFQRQAGTNGVADREAEAFRNIANAPAHERQFGDSVQALGPFPVFETSFDLSDLDVNDIQELAQVNTPGLSGRRAVFVEVDDNDNATVLLGTQVSFNAHRYTRNHWDQALSEALNGRPTAEDNRTAAEDLTAQATELRDIAGLLRKRGSGSLFSGPTDPELIALAGRLDVVAVKLAGESPKVTAPSFDVDQALEKGREVLDQWAQKSDVAVRKFRGKLADIINGRKP